MRYTEFSTFPVFDLYCSNDCTVEFFWRGMILFASTGKRMSFRSTVLAHRCSNALNCLAERDICALTQVVTSALCHCVSLIMYQPCVTHVSTLCHTCINPVSHMYQPCVTHVSTLCHSCINLVSHMYQPCVTLSHMYQPCVTHVSTLCHTCINPVSHCHTCINPVSHCHTCINPVSHMYQPCVTQKKYSLA